MKLETGERGRTVSFLGIFVSNFRYSAFAVRGVHRARLLMDDGGTFQKQFLFLNTKAGFTLIELPRRRDGRGEGRFFSSCSNPVTPFLRDVNLSKCPMRNI
jgi:hypothetical protein